MLIPFETAIKFHKYFKNNTTLVYLNKNEVVLFKNQTDFINCPTYDELKSILPVNLKVDGKIEIFKICYFTQIDAVMCGYGRISFPADTLLKSMCLLVNYLININKLCIIEN